MEFCMSQDEIGSLLPRVALKDRAAFDRLYALAAPKLFGVLLRILNERSEAEDALQEVFVKIWSRADRYAQSDASALGWLCAIARNHAIDKVRARQKPSQPIDEAYDIADDAPDPERGRGQADRPMHGRTRTRQGGCRQAGLCGGPVL